MVDKKIWPIQATAATWRAGGRQGKPPTLGESWSFGLVGYTQDNLVLGPNARHPNGKTNGTGTIESPGVFGLSSLLPGGAIVLFLDGSVRFLKDSVSLRTIWALGSTRQGEILSANDL